MSFNDIDSNFEASLKRLKQYVLMDDSIVLHIIEAGTLCSNIRDLADYICDLARSCYRLWSQHCAPMP